MVDLLFGCHKPTAMTRGSSVERDAAAAELRGVEELDDVEEKKSSDEGDSQIFIPVGVNEKSSRKDFRTG